jgi:hypothetical protein
VRKKEEIAKKSPSFLFFPADARSMETLRASQTAVAFFRRNGTNSELKGMRVRLVRNLAILLLCLQTGTALAQDAIGYVKSVEGTTEVVRSGKSSAIGVGDAVFVADLLVVKGSGSMGITFIDNSQLSMGSGSQLRLKNFEFVPKEEKLSFVTELLKGTLLYVSGVIAKLSPDAVSVVTPVATLSVRGTRFLVRVDE